MTLSSDIHPSSFVGEGVSIGDGSTVGPGAVLLGPLTIGAGTRIGPNAVIGTPPEISSLSQNHAWRGELEHHGVRLGDGVVVREGVTIQQGSTRTTMIGAGTWLLSNAYVAHDVIIGSDAVVSAGARLGGHVVVGPLSNIGMNAAVHQRRSVGAGAMIGMSTPVTRDVPDFAKVYGSPARMHGLNSFVLARLGLDDTQISQIGSLYQSGRPDLGEWRDLPAFAALREWWSTYNAGQDIAWVPTP
jgi:UDP-N-acetylglucosamine acyltransferase